MLMKNLILIILLALSSCFDAPNPIYDNYGSYIVYRIDSNPRDNYCVYRIKNYSGNTINGHPEWYREFALMDNCNKFQIGDTLKLNQ